MKKLFLILLSSFFVLACSNDNREEGLIIKTVENYYECLNKRDFKNLETIVSARMNKKIPYFKELGKNLVIYEKVKVENIELNGNTAFVEVECVDEFGNKIVCNWNLSKINEEWKMDIIDVSASEF